jgi:hypothetical protein
VRALDRSQKTALRFTSFKEHNMQGIDRAIEAAGGVVAMAKAVGVAHQVVTRWKKNGYVPAKRVAAVSALFNVSARDLMDPRLVELASDIVGE